MAVNENRIKSVIYFLANYKSKLPSHFYTHPRHDQFTGVLPTTNRQPNHRLIIQTKVSLLPHFSLCCFEYRWEQVEMLTSRLNNSFNDSLLLREVSTNSSWVFKSRALNAHNSAVILLYTPISLLIWTIVLFINVSNYEIWWQSRLNRKWII